MKTLLVYPEFPDTYWSFRHALSFEGKRSAYPPLGALTRHREKFAEAMRLAAVGYHFRKLTEGLNG
jgi:hypothetical protein